jgi:hypothetical protein
MSRKRRTTSKQPTWSDLKSQLREMDQNALLALIKDMYTASKDNQAFLHARFALGKDVLEPYKAIILRWVCPDIFRNQDYSVSRAQRAIADYRKALGRAEDTAELTVFYCEQCVCFLSSCGVDDEPYYDALVRVFAQAIKAIAQLDAANQRAYIKRLEAIRSQGHRYGYGVGDDMDQMMSEFRFNVD